MKHVLRTLLVLLLLPLLFQPHKTQAAATTPSHGTCSYAIESSIDALVDDLFASEPIPGLSLAVGEDGEVVCEKGYGVRDVNTQKPMLSYTRSSIGSVTKVIATMGMMHLIENPPESMPGLGILTPVYDGILTSQDYKDAYEQGIQRHTPILDVAIGTDQQLVTWYSDGTYTIGTNSDLDAVQGAMPFTLPSGQMMTEVVAIARGGADNRVYSWYRDGRYSIGTPNDLDAFGSFWTIIDGEEKPFRSFGIAKIVAISMNEDADKFTTFYHNGVVSIGTSPENLHDWVVDNYVPAGDSSRTYDIVGVARTLDDNKLPEYVTLYSDGQGSVGTVTNLGATEGLFNVAQPTIAGARQAWRDAYSDMRIYHLLSHTAGFIRSGDQRHTAIKYGYDVDAYDPATNPPAWKDRFRYVLSTEPLLTPPGTDYSYSNHAMGLVGYLIEEVSGVNWFPYINEHILDPAGATHMATYGTYYVDGQDGFDATPHLLNADDELVAQPLPLYNHYGSAAGALKGNAGDVVRVMLATDREATYPDVLEDATLAVMEAQWFPTAASNMLLGWHVNCQNDNNCSDERRLNHNGSLNGSIAFAARYDNYQINAETADGISVVLIINRDSAGSLLTSMSRLSDDIAELVEAIDYPDLTLPDTDSVRPGDREIIFGTPMPSGSYGFSTFHAAFLNNAEVAHSESYDAGDTIMLHSTETADFPPDGWVCAPHVNFCTPSVIVQVAPGGCPNGWRDAPTAGSCEPDGAGGVVDPTEIMWNLGNEVTSPDCPSGWIRPIGTPFCVPDSRTIDDPNGTSGRPDGCPPNWIVSDAPGGCSPEFIQASTGNTPRTSGCPEGFHYVPTVNFCVADTLAAPSPCHVDDAQPACNYPEWDIYFAESLDWQSDGMPLITANHLRLSRPDGRTDIAAAQIDFEWTCDLQDDLTAKCQAAIAITDSCLDVENCSFLSSTTPTAVTLYHANTGRGVTLYIILVVTSLLLLSRKLLLHNRRF